MISSLAAPTGAAVRVRGLVSTIGRVRVLDAVNLTVPEGAAYLLTGPNGAGKSWLLRQVLHLSERNSGHVEVLGRDPARDGAVVRAAIGYVPPPGPHPYSWMRLHRLLAHQSEYYAAWDGAYAQGLLERLSLDPARRVRDMSDGEMRRAALLLALAVKPPLLILDDPTAGLDPLGREHLLRAIAAHLAEHGGTLLVATHAVSDVVGLVDHVGVMTGGHLVAETTCERIRTMLFRYRFDAPVDAPIDSALVHAAIATRRRGRDVEWLVWGPEDWALARFATSAIDVRSASPVHLEDAVQAIARAERPLHALIGSTEERGRDG